MKKKKNRTTAKDLFNIKLYKSYRKNNAFAFYERYSNIMVKFLDFLESNNISNEEITCVFSSFIGFTLAEHKDAKAMRVVIDSIIDSFLTYTEEDFCSTGYVVDPSVDFINRTIEDLVIIT